MKEKDLIELGFECNYETPESSGDDHDWHYYTLDIGIDNWNSFCLISNTSDDIKDDEWKVYIFDNDSFEFTDSGTLELLINTLKHNMVKNG